VIQSIRRSPWWYVPLALGAAGVAAFQPVSVGLGLALLLVGGVLVLKRPVWGVYALVLSVPVQRELSIAGRATATQAIMAGLLFVWWAWMALGQRKIRLPAFALALAAYLLVLVVSLAVATSLGPGLAEIARWTVVLLSYIIIVNTVRTRAEIVGLVLSFLVGAAAEGLLGLQQVATRQVPPSFFVGQGSADPEALAPRAFGTIGAPNSYAGYLNLTLCLAIAVSLYLLVARPRILDFRFPILDKLASLQNPKSKIQNLASVGLVLGAVAATALMLGGMVVSFSRGGLIGLTVGVVSMVVALGRRAVPALVGLAAGAALLIALTFGGVLPSSVQDRVVSAVEQLQVFDVRGITATADTFNQIERLAIWQAAGNMYLTHPWLGVGVGNYNVVYPQYALPDWQISEGQAHNYFLQALAETGLVGLLAYLAMLGIALGTGWQAVRRAVGARRGWDSALLIGAFGVVMAVAGHSIFEDLHVLNLGIHWAAVIALFQLVKA
jgi:O-antigen ligase